ncbi:unnamed protein product [Dovyalis caffra]|uniref:Ribosome-inactivating protein n=1 Tax=Dovyalis caffra TaxID=77055 RepID=A0AAV1SU10_9ROSI|nr:unnamed protein product [Dovyalis caffra]
MKVLVIAATWIWSAMVGAAWNSDLCLVSTEVRFGITLPYTVVSFTTADATRKSYSEFLQDLRGHLASGNKVHDIPVMREPSTVTESDLLVELSNSLELSVTLAINVTNAYVVAYRASDQSYFFSDSKGPAFSKLFTETKRDYLSFTGNYIDLQRIAGAGRKDIPLGMSALDQAITNLYYWRSGPGNTEYTVARSLLVAIQMVAEAARFRYIENSVCRSIKATSNFLPDEAMLSLENNWRALSTAIQQSNQGVFARPVQLRKRDGTFFNVDSVTVTDSLISNLGLLLFVCNPQASRFKRSMDAKYYSNNVCSVPEPTIRITGRNGLCADVKDGVYADGNPIQLQQCKSTPELNQLWTLKKDRKIQSNGKCLTKDNRLSSVMIYDCNKAVTMGANVLWEVRDDGSIIDPRSKLALSTSSGNAGSNLNMATNNYASSQGWLANNNTTPFVTSIVGFDDLCLVQGDRTSLWLAECRSGRIEQKWALYADGSIRPQQQQEMCISCNSNNQPGTIVLILPCSGSSQQRWMFKNDGTMLNLFSRLVMDVRRSDPSLKEIIISQPTGNLSQKWLPVP